MEKNKIEVNVSIDENKLASEIAKNISDVVRDAVESVSEVVRTSVTDRPATWPETTKETVYDYSFCVFPDSQHPRMRGNKAVFELFNLVSHRAVLEFTETNFNNFREELAKVGLVLMEIERTPHFDAQAVF